MELGHYQWVSFLVEVYGVDYFTLEVGNSLVVDPGREVIIKVVVIIKAFILVAYLDDKNLDLGGFHIIQLAISDS